MSPHRTTTAGRTVLEIDLKPLIGSRFQPTGFADLGAAEFDGPDGVRTLLVESYASMANWLEATTWDPALMDQRTDLTGLPYVRIVDADKQFLTSSRLEAHRLNSSYLMAATLGEVRGSDWLRDRLGLVKGRPLDHRQVARACFALDPFTLIHGVYFPQKSWPWQPRITRAVTSFIEAYGVRPAVSGGVKRDVVINTAADGATSEGYGSVPFTRTEYTAERITAYVSVDHDQIRSYGLPEPATALLEALIDFQLGTLFTGGLRLRTACDLTITDVRTGQVPNADDALQRVTALIGECRDDFDGITEAVWTGRVK